MAILGILSIWQGEERFDRPFGMQTPLFEAISRSGKTNRFRTHVYIPQQTENKEKLNAYTYLDGKWKPVLVPPPNVVYDRLPSRQIENDPEVLQFRKFLLKKTGGRLFNRAGFFSKSFIYSTVRTVLPKNLHLPETELNPDSENIIKLISLWGEAWLKPDDGSLGQGIYRLLKEPFGISVESSDQGSADHFETEEAFEFFKELLSQKRYILQRGIQRTEKNLRPFDIRVYLQKDQIGKFIVTQQFAKLVDFGQIVSNLHAGGDSTSLRGLLSKTERSNLRKLSLDFAKRLNLLLPQPLGEIALDLILDPSRRFWLIEVNSKPFLKMDPDNPITSKTARRILGYAKYLLNQSAKKKLKSRNKPTTLQPKLKLSPHASKGRQV